MRSNFYKPFDFSKEFWEFTKDLLNDYREKDCSHCNKCDRKKDDNKKHNNDEDKASYIADLKKEIERLIKDNSKLKSEIDKLKKNETCSDSTTTSENTKLVCDKEGTHFEVSPLMESLKELLIDIYGKILIDQNDVKKGFTSTYTNCGNVDLFTTYSIEQDNDEKDGVRYIYKWRDPSNFVFAATVSRDRISFFTVDLNEFSKDADIDLDTEPQIRDRAIVVIDMEDVETGFEDLIWLIGKPIGELDRFRFSEKFLWDFFKHLAICMGITRRNFDDL